MKDELNRRINFVRRDLGNLLFHFTRKPESAITIEGERYTSHLSQSALSVLKKNLAEEFLKGSSKNIRGGFSCICFTEPPISELASLFALVNIATTEHEKTRYEPYGIAVRKE